MKANSTESKYELQSCTWELTLKCTMNCLHCGSHAGAARNKELTLDECRLVADDLVALGCQECTLIGGEVFLYRGWEKLARYLTDAGVAVNIITNGYRLTQEQLLQIKHAKLMNVGVSIDGMLENHTRIRRKRDGFTEAVKTLDLLRQEGIPTGVVTCLFEFNCGDLEDMYEFLVQEGVSVWQLQLTNPMGNLSGREDLTINPARLPGISDFIRDKNRERVMMVVAANSIGYFDGNESQIRGVRAPINCWRGCQAGVSSVGIDSVGNVKGCAALYDDAFIEGNVRDSSLSAIWNEETNFEYNRGFEVGMLSGKCKTCAVGDVCQGGCRAFNFFAGGSLYECPCCIRNQPRTLSATASSHP